MGEEKYEGKIESREYLPGDDGSGMGLTGKWMNKRTGKAVNIRQTIQDGDNMIIISDQGQIPMEVFSRDYVQVSDDIYDESGKVVGHEEATNSDIGAIEEYEKMYGVDPLVPQATPTAAPINNEQIIKKVFDKLSSYPQIDVNIKWDNFPEAQLKTLTDFLDISLDDISKYILKNYLNEDILVKSVSKMLEERLNSK